MTYTVTCYTISYANISLRFNNVFNNTRWATHMFSLYILTTVTYIPTTDVIQEH